MANDVHKIKLLLLWDILFKNTDEDHALNTDEIVDLLALRGVNVSRKILVQDIATLCNNGYEVLSYKKKYHHYYVVNRALETAEVVMFADVITPRNSPCRKRKRLHKDLRKRFAHIKRRTFQNISFLSIKAEREIVRLSTTWTQ